MEEPGYSFPRVSVQDLGVGRTPRSRPVEVIKHSAFFITINTNKGAIHCDIDALIPEFRAALRDLYGRPGLRAGLIRFLVPGEGMEKVISTDSRFKVEIGQHPKGSRVHSHALYQVKHQTMIRLNIPVIYQFILERIRSCPLTNLYVHIDVVPFAESDIMAYLNKYIDDANT